MQNDPRLKIGEMSSTAILVLGMHRSGTSAATRILNILGAHLGSDLLTPQADNKKGFWEHTDAIDIHERFLSALGRNWHDVREMPKDWMHHPAADEAVDQIVELIKRDMMGVRLWAVKDPRMCRLAPLWIKALQRMHMRTTVLIVVRDPYEVVRSLNVRDNWTHAHAYLMWAQHLFESIRASEHISRSLLSYDELMIDWRSSFMRIERDLGITWDKSIDEAVAQIEEFISQDERHHKVLQNGNSDAEVPPVVAHMYQACKEIMQGHRDWSVLNSYNDSYQTVMPLFSKVISELATDRGDLERLAIERWNSINVLNDELVKRDVDNRVLKDELMKREDELTKREISNQNLRAENDSLRASITKLLSEEVELHGSMQNQTRHIVGLESERIDLEKAVTGHLYRYNDMRSLINSRRWLLGRFIKLTLRAVPGTRAVG